MRTSFETQPSGSGDMARGEIRAFPPAPRRSAAVDTRVGGLRPRARRLWLAAAMLVTLSGCARDAPLFSIVGAYFPAWLLCAIIGLLAAIASRVAMITLLKTDALPLQLSVCTSIGLFIAFITWLSWFGG